MLSFWRKRPTSDEIARRLEILRAVVFYALRTPPLEGLRAVLAMPGEDAESEALRTDLTRGQQELLTALRASGLWADMTTDEQSFMSTAPWDLQAQQHRDATWLAEGAFCLMWALHHVHELIPYDCQVETALVLPRGDRPGASDSRPRSPLEIARARDVAELWHWRSRTRQLQEQGPEIELPEGLTLDQIVEMAATEAHNRGDISEVIQGDFAVFGVAYRDASPEQYAVLTSIAMERHRALNWLAGKARGRRWDKTPTDT